MSPDINWGVLFFLIIFSVLMIGIWFWSRGWKRVHLRDIPAFSRMRGAIELAVEDGARIHVSIGRNDITSPHSGIALAGLGLVRQIAIIASDSDLPPITSTGNGMLSILAQDTVRGTYNGLGLASSYSNDLVRVSGLTPYAYAAGIIPLANDEDVAANVLLGSYQNEAALMVTAGQSEKTFSLAGTDTLAGQAVVYAASEEVLIGEEVFAGSAYLSRDKLEIASLHAQDAVRWLLIVYIVLSALVGIFGGGGQ